MDFPLMNVNAARFFCPFFEITEILWFQVLEYRSVNQGNCTVIIL